MTEAGLYQLIYISKAKVQFTKEELDTLVIKASHFNKEKSITGALIFGKGYFLQILEGKKPTIKILFEKIKSDPRHKHILELHFSSAEKRVFPDWNMALLNLDTDEKIDLEGFNEIIQAFEGNTINKIEKHRALSVIGKFRSVMQ